jgi:hypothetical protein
MEMENNVPMSDISIPAIETQVVGGTLNSQTRPCGLSPLASLYLDSEARVAVRPAIVVGVGSGREALLLAQIIYWIEPAKKDGVWQNHRGAKEMDGCCWVIKSHADFARETGLSPDQVKRGLRTLRREGFIEVRRFASRRRRTSCSRISITVQTIAAFPGAIKLAGEFGSAHEGYPQSPATYGGLLRAPQDPRVLVYARTVRMTANANAAIVLARILFWYGDGRNGSTRLRTRRWGKWCLVKTYTELAEETGLKSCQVRSAIGRLCRLSLIRTEIHLFAGGRALWIFLDRAEFVAQWQRQDSLDVSRGIGQARQP